jgi:hypothetical protein
VIAQSAWLSGDARTSDATTQKLPFDLYSTSDPVCRWCGSPAVALSTSRREPVCEYCGSPKLPKRLPKVRAQPLQGYVYLIQAGDDGPVKIGWSRNPFGRMSEFQAAHFAELRLIDKWPGTERDERLLQKHLAEFRIRGEWFDPVILYEIAYAADLKARA